MSAIYCPHCNEPRPKPSHSSQETRCDIKECSGCGNTFPECPKCGSRKTDFSDQNRLGCYRCEHEFSPPESLQNKGRKHWTGQRNTPLRGGEHDPVQLVITSKDLWTSYWDRQKADDLLDFLKMVSEEEVSFLICVARGMSEVLRGDLPHPRRPPHGHHTGGRALHQEHRWEYLSGVFRRYVQIPSLLELRQHVSKLKNKRLPPAKYFADKVLAEPSDLVDPVPEVRQEWGRVARDVVHECLGIRATKSIRTDIVEPIIQECYRKRDQYPSGTLFTNIAKELDAVPDATTDPILDTWNAGLETILISFTAALADPTLKVRVEKFFSRIGNNA